MLRFSSFLTFAIILCVAGSFEVSAQNLDAESATGSHAFDGSSTLTVNVRAGGSDRVSVRGSGCAGHIASNESAAQIDVSANGKMSISASSDDVDLTMVVADPSGSFHCSDDVRGSNPAVTFSQAAEGTYLVWVGTYSPGEAGTPAVLRVSAGDPAW